MPDNNTNKLFKKKIEALSEIPSSIKWNKDNSWKKLQRKRRRKFMISFTYYAAAIIIIGLIISNVYLGKRKPLIEYNNDGQYTEMSEFQKRQKLKEIEDRMTGDKTRNIICFTCEDDYFISNTDKRPAKFRYFQSN